MIIEVDENQHKAKSYTPECEIQRINNLFTEAQEKYYFAKGQELFKSYSNTIEQKLDELILENGNIDDFEDVIDY